MSRVSALPRDAVAIALAYSVAWGALVVNRGLYWDDWTLLGRSAADLVSGFTELGLPLGGIAYAGLFALPLPGLVGHVLIFAMYLASSLLLYAIVRRLPGLRRMDALVAALTFALFPVNYARIALIDSMYALSLLAFIAATWLVIRFIESGGTARRIAALVLYLFSFYTASLLVFYVVPVALAAVLLWRSRRASGPVLALRHADFLVLPLAYWVAKGVFLTPTGAYEGYNELSAAKLLDVPRAMVSIPSQVVVEPLMLAVRVAGLLGVAAGVVLALWLVRRHAADDAGASVPGPVLAVVGVLLVLLAVFAYLAVGLRPTIWDWSSRHQLLVPIGVGLIAAAIARGMGRLGPVGRHGGLAIVGLILGISAIADARTLVTYQIDWFKQQALIRHVETTAEVATASHIRVVDTATGFNALRRTYRFYELNAMFEQALGGQHRLVALEDRDPAPADMPLFLERPAYHMVDYVPGPVDLEIRVSPGQRPGPLGALRLVVLEAVDPPAFRAEVEKLIDLTASEPTGTR